jgi:chemotaxis family two-component system response regulator Rcp1
MMSQERLKILLAEDNSGDVFLVRRALQKHHIDHELTVVEDGEAAMRYLDAAGSSADTTQCPDLILLDLNLPRCSGSQILERLKTNPAYRNPPVIVLTSSDSPHDRANAIGLGAARYFCKPTDLAGFMSLGQVVLDVMASH